ncbi:MAG: Holliday junction resolvase RecU [Mycoplasmataceae bacterium]|jgi:recombination protein U|nr:Holliday junction resolvase RecU [Mycoplasmataceae bacterium]
MYANRGMYAEEVVNRTIDYLSNTNCLIEKRNIPIKIVKELNGNLVIGKLLSKSTVDYCGFANCKHIEFEVKQTSQVNFSVEMIKPHQYSYLLKAEHAGSIAFVIVYFSLHDKFHLLPIKWIDECTKINQTKTIKYDRIAKECQLLSIVYPGILNLLEKI